MEKRIETLRQNLLDKKHHAHRQSRDVKIDTYRDKDRTDFERTSLRLCLALENETPVLLPEERIVFTRTLPALPGIYAEDEWEAIKAAHFIHEAGNVCNLSPDYERLIREGLKEQKQKIAAKIAENPQDVTKIAYWQSMQRSIDAVLGLVVRYEKLAREQGREDVAQVLSRVPARGARTFREALQSLRILHFAMWCEGDYHNTLGRFDQYMFPYLKKDLESGELTEDEAFSLLEEFFLACNRDSDLYPGMQQGDNGQSMVLGGMTPEGKDGYQKLSEMCLRASAELRVIDPKINLRVNKDTPLSVYEEGTRLTKLGLGFPQYENDDVVIPGLERLGYAQADARNYVVAACWEFIIPGVGMDIPNIGALSFAGAVQEALKKSLFGAKNMQDVKDAVQREIREETAKITASFHDLYVIPSPYLSLFFEGCLEGARDISLGNRYNNYGLHGTGLATAADSLAAVEQTVFQEGGSPEALLTAIDRNFEGDAALRTHLLLDCPKMGNDDDRADGYGCFLLDSFAGSLEGLRNERGGIFRAGTGSAMFYVWHGADMGATADGRLASEPLPANYAPALGVKVKGPASVLRSFAKPELSRVVNGGPLTIEFSDSVFRGDESITKVAQLVRSYILAGGHQLQLNTVNRDQLLDAQAHPENYRNLIVRVWGWSGYFVELDKCYQDHIIQRVELLA